MLEPFDAWSLQRRLTAIVLFVCSATLLAGGSAMYRADQVADEHLLDARLVELAHVVLLFAEHEIEEAVAEGRADAIQDTDVAFATRYHYQIWSPDGNLLLRSRDAPTTTALRPLGERGFGLAIVDGEPVRTYAQANRDAGMVMLIAERVSDRKSAAGDVTRNFLAFLIVPMVSIAACIWVLLRRTLRSVRGYTSQLQAHDPHALIALDGAGAPTELRRLVDSINGLFARFRQTLSVERDFATFAAHELRAPLAALRAQAQLAAELVQSPQDLSRSLRGLLASVDQASHLLDRMLDLARAESLAAQAGQGLRPIDLQQLYRSVMYDLGPVAAANEVSVRARFEVGALPAVELGLHLLLHNLLANAIRFAPRGGQIEIGSSARAATTVLAVDDSGPGIPASRHAEALQRFNRLGRSDAHGVGLGLSIVQTVAEAHHATVHLGLSSLGGLRVEVHFPVGPR